VSDEAADVLAEVAHQFSTSVSQELARRIADATDPDVVDLVIMFASEVIAFGDGRPLHLALDDADRLGDPDQRRVMDLIELLPDGMALRLSFKTWDSHSRDKSQELVMAGAAPVELEGLSETAISEWLVAEGLPTDWAADVRAATNGFPLYVSDAIDLLRDAESTGVLVGLEPRAVLRTQTERTWNELDIITQVSAARLAAFTDPLDPTEAAEVLGIGPSEWGALQRRLSDSGMFTGVPPWFHQLRRRHLWDQILTPEERDDARGRAIDYVTPQLAFPIAQPDAFVEYARLVPHQAQLLAENPKLGAAASADADEIAIVASLIELAVPTPSAFLAENVLLYARQVFHARGDVVAALQGLAERNLVHLESNRFATAVVATFGSIEVVNLLAGRAAAELGRLPVPQVATSLFEVELRDALSPFRAGHYGVGSPSVAELSKFGVEMQRVRPDGSMHFGRKGPNLLVRFRYDQLPLYATVAYNDEVSRDDAARRIDGFTDTVLDRPLVVTDVLKHPMTPVPSLRFLQAAELLTGQSLSNAIRGAGTTPRLEVPVALDEEMARRAAVLALVRDLCGPEEMLAYGLEQPIGYVYFGNTDRSEIAQVVGSQGAHPLPHLPAASIESGFHRVEMAQMLALGPEERIGLMTWRQGEHREEPVLAELAWLSKRAHAFNDLQDRVAITMEEPFLQDALTEATQRAAEDAARLGAALTIEGVDNATAGPPMGRTTYLVLFLEEPNQRFVPGAFATVMWTYVTNDTGEFEAHIRVRPSSERNASIPTWTSIAPFFGLDPALDLNGGYGEARSVLSKLLGYCESEVSFQYS